jgi:spermidine synthase
MATKKLNAQALLLLAVLVIATCGLIYELVAGTLASYLIGDSVTQFSLIIGVYLFSMGIGSYLSKFFHRHLLSWFIRVELLVGLIGGCSAAILFMAFPLVAGFSLILYLLVGLTGVLVGLEIPLLMRILQHKVEFKDLVSRVFTFDYIGALLASVIFPLALVPFLGLIRTSLLFGMMNIGVGWYLAHYFRREIRDTVLLKSTAILLLLVELLGFVYADQIMSFSESLHFNDTVIFAKSSPYQRLVITSNSRELRLFLNGNLQFSTADEYRYHEALVHPAMSSVAHPEKILVLGGGDGLAVRELLKYPSVQQITLVDLDPLMTRLFRTQPILLKVNDSSLLQPRVKVFNQDAFTWLMRNQATFDAVIVDFPDPSNYAIGKLYSRSFYQELQRAIAPTGIAVIQCTSPLAAPNSFWCIDTTLKSVGLLTRPYHNYVPSFGEWGYIMAMPSMDHQWYAQLPDKLKYVNRQTIEQMLYFPADMQPKEKLEPNKLNNQVLVHSFEKEWDHYLN